MKISIQLAVAEKGMILAVSVENDSGVVLCAEGTILTDEIIQRFNQMGITEIYVENEDILSQEDYLDLQHKIEQRFVLTSDHHTLPGKLKTVLLKRLEARKGSLKQ